MRSSTLDSLHTGVSPGSIGCSTPIVALLEKRRFLYNHSGDFPQVILIIPSHVPNITLSHKRKLCRCFYLKLGSLRMMKALGKNKNIYWLFLFSKCSSDEMSSLLIPMRFRWKHNGEIKFIGEISSKFLYGPRCFLLVYWQNSWFLLVHCFAPVCFSKLLDKRLVEDCEKYNFCLVLEYELPVHRNPLKWRNLQIMFSP